MCVSSCALVCVRAGVRVRVHSVRRTLDLYQLHKDRHICLRVDIKQENSNKRLACLERESAPQVRKDGRGFKSNIKEFILDTVRN